MATNHICYVARFKNRGWTMMYDYTCFGYLEGKHEDIEEFIFILPVQNGLFDNKFVLDYINDTMDFFGLSYDVEICDSDTKVHQYFADSTNNKETVYFIKLNIPTWMRCRGNFLSLGIMMRYLKERINTLWYYKNTKDLFPKDWSILTKIAYLQTYVVHDYSHGFLENNSSNFIARTFEEMQFRLVENRVHTTINGGSAKVSDAGIKVNSMVGKPVSCNNGFHNRKTPLNIQYKNDVVSIPFINSQWKFA